jgi:hypothetical protein
VVPSIFVTSGCMHVKIGCMRLRFE